MKSPSLFTALLCCCLAAPGLAAEKTLNQSTEYPATPGKVLLVDVASLDVAVRTADVREIGVTFDLHISGVNEDRAVDWMDRHTPTIEDSGDKLSITARPGKNGFLGFGLLTARSRISIVVPRSVVLDLTTTSGKITLKGDFSEAQPVRLRTADGDVEFTGAAHSLEMHSASGDAHIDVVRPFEKLFARTSSGTVTVVGGARSVHVDTASGGVWLDNLSGSVEAESSIGRMNLRWDRIDPVHTVTVQTSSGRVDLVLPADASPRGSLTTTSGSIKSGFPGVVDEEGTTVTLKGDGPVFTVVATTGEILLSQGEE